jgi:hypothetical protein
MKKSLLATAAGLLLMACSGMQTPAPGIGSTPAPAPAPASTPAPTPAPRDQIITLLERACLSDPMNAAKWEALAAALATDGQRERALKMYEQAATLHAHDARRDYALLQANARSLPVAPSPAAPADPMASMPRTEVRQIGAAMVEVLRVAPTLAALSTSPSASASASVSALAPGLPADPQAPSPLPLPLPAPAQTMPALVRLEISNGNGVTGAAARMARSLSVDGLKTVRLTNVKNFDVPLSRIEYRQEQQRMAESLAERLGLPLKATDEASSRSDMRLVLGHDATPATRFK